MFVKNIFSFYYWPERLKKKIAELERKCDIFSAETRQANEGNKQLREASRLENIRLNLENKQLQLEFIDQRSMQNALYKSSKKVKKLEKKLNVHSSKEEPYVFPLFQTHLQAQFQ